MAALAELTDTISVAADAISTNFELQHRSNSTPFDRRTCNESAINDVSGGRTGETAGTVDGAVTTGHASLHSPERRAEPGCRSIRRLSPAGPV
jgi:hypothetical protein